MKKILGALLLTLFSFVGIAAAATTLSTNLSFGSRGDDVVSLQNALVQDGLLPVAVPRGYFGNLTLAAVKSYQAENNITTTGFVGPLTRQALSQEGDSADSTDSSSDMSQTSDTTNVITSTPIASSPAATTITTDTSGVSPFAFINIGQMVNPPVAGTALGVLPIINFPHTTISSSNGSTQSTAGLTGSGQTQTTQTLTTQTTQTSLGSPYTGSLAPTIAAPVGLGWSAGPWSQCTNGVQVRDVSCENNGSAVGPLLCSGAAPAKSQSCVLGNPNPNIASCGTASTNSWQTNNYCYDGSSPVGLTQNTDGTYSWTCITGGTSATCRNQVAPRYCKITASITNRVLTWTKGSDCDNSQTQVYSSSLMGDNTNLVYVPHTCDSNGNSWVDSNCIQGYKLSELGYGGDWTQGGTISLGNYTGSFYLYSTGGSDYNTTFGLVKITIVNGVATSIK